MQENSNPNTTPESDLQNEINSFIKPIPDQNTPPQPEQVAPQVAAVTSNIEENPGYPPVNQQPQAVQAPQVLTSDKTYSQSNNNLVYILIAVIVALAIGAGGLILKEQGASSFEDCIKVVENTRVLLEPAYCVNKKGKILYQNLTDKEVEEMNKTDELGDYGPFETPLP